MIIFEVYLACLGCGLERVLGTLPATDATEARKQALIQHPDASVEELYVRPAAEQQQFVYVEDHVA